MKQIIQDRATAALEHIRKYVDSMATLRYYRDGGFKIESTCKVSGRWVDIYGKDGRLQAHLKG